MGVASEPSALQERTVGPLVLRGPLEALPGARLAVLLDNEPAAIADLAKRGDEAIGIQVTLAERGECVSRPDRRRRCAVGDDAREYGPSGVLQVDLVDAGRPGSRRCNRIATGEEQVPGVQAQPDVRELEHPLDLPRRLDVRAGLAVERRFVPPIPARRP